MRLTSIPGTSKRLRRMAATLHQRTFVTPVDYLTSFVAILLPATSSLKSASLTLENIVFTPDHLETLLSNHHLPPTCEAGWTITATGFLESHALLAAPLADAVDFYFLPEPKAFLLLADHDQYATLYAARKGTLSQLAAALATAGVSEVTSYLRPN